MTWSELKDQARELLKTKGREEVRRHARVSIENRHHCRECFTCACVAVLAERAK